MPNHAGPLWGRVVRLTLTPGRAVTRWRYVVLRFIVATESQVGEDHDERY